MLFKESTIKSDKIFSGKIIDLRVDTVELPEGRLATREIVEHPGGVCVVPITKEGKIIMVKQFRKPVEDFLLEIPAGKLELNENPLLCAIRELKEETGYISKDIKFLLNFYSSPGFSNEILHIYVAKELEEGEATPDEDEYIDIECYELEKVIEMIHRGEIKDSKTIIGILALNRYLSKD